MKKRSIFKSTLIVGLILLSASAVSATTIWGTDVIEENDLHSSRTSDENGGVFATGKWADGSFKIEWNIEQDPTTEYWTYTYTLSGKKEISQFILEITEDEIGFNIFEGSDPVKDIDTWDSSGAISFNELYGIKFDFGGEPATYTLVTDSSPVWGVFFAKSEHNDDYALSTALLNADYKTNEDLTNFAFIARPDGGSLLAGLTSVPEPPTMLLIGVGLIGLAGLGRNNIFKRKKR